MFLNEVTLVFTAEVHTPVSDRELKLHTVSSSFLKNLETLCVSKASEVFLQYTLQASDKFLVNHLIEELKVVFTVLQSPANTILDEVFLKVHQFFLVDESNLRLNHPELSQVAWSI